MNRAKADVTSFSRKRFVWRVVHAVQSNGSRMFQCAFKSLPTGTSIKRKTVLYDR